MSSSITKHEAELYCLDHQTTSPIEVYIKCVKCGCPDEFADCSLRYGPTGSTHEHNDYCGNCNKSCKDFVTTKITCDGKEVIF